MSRTWVSHCTLRWEKHPNVTNSIICHINNKWLHTNSWVMSHLNVMNVSESLPNVTNSIVCHMNNKWLGVSHVTETSEVWRKMNDCTHMHESCHMWLCHGTHVTVSWHTYEQMMCHIWMSHVTHMNESCHTYEWVMSHIWMSHVTHMNESCHTYEW